MQWFKKLLEKLKQPSLIIMDNASYHTCLPSTAPKNIHKMAKNDMRALLEKHGVPTDPSDLREDVMQRLREWRATSIPPAVVSAAREQGHEVLFTPPRMCELQPIERVFGIVKGRIGRRHHAGIDYSKTRDMLFEEVARVHKQRHKDGARTMIQAVIDSSVREVMKYKQQMDTDPVRRLRVSTALDATAAGENEQAEQQQQQQQQQQQVERQEEEDHGDDDDDVDWEFDETDEEDSDCEGDDVSDDFGDAGDHE